MAIKAVAKANGLDLTIADVDFAKPRTVEHLKASTLGKVPAFVGADGFTLCEAIAVAVYSKLRSFSVHFCLDLFFLATQIWVAALLVMT